MYNVEEEKAVIKYKCENDLLFFTRYFFKHREGIKFQINEHHKIIAETLAEVEKGTLKNVIFNVSPGASKTELVIINFMAQSLAKYPRARFLHISYSDELVALNSSKTKDIILSDEYQQFWPLKIKADTKSKKRWNVQYFNQEENKYKDGGGCYAVSLGGAVTGFRAGHMDQGFQGAILIDDPLKVEDSYSSVHRKRANQILTSTIKSRKANPNTPIIIIMQRLHEEDPSGFLLDGGSGDEWEHVKIPAILTDDRGREFSYWEYKEPLHELQAMRKADPYTFAGQYMQEPAPIGGGEFKSQFIQYYNQESKSFTSRGMNVWILYDPANEKKVESDYTAMVVVGLASDNNYYILDLVRDKLNPTERINKLIDLHKKWNEKSGQPPKVACEQYGMMTDEFYLKKAQDSLNYRFRIVKVAGKLKKEDRIRRLVPLWESERIYLPRKILYTDYENNQRELVKEFIDDELLFFPKGKNDDMIDACSRITDDDVKAAFPTINVIHLKAGQGIEDFYAENFNKNDFMSW